MKDSIKEIATHLIEKGVKMSLKDITKVQGSLKRRIKKIGKGEEKGGKALSFRRGPGASFRSPSAGGAMSFRGEGLTVPEKHQLAIAKKTLKMPDAMAGVMGGMSKDEAKKVVAKLSKKEQAGRKEGLEEAKKFKVGQSVQLPNGDQLNVVQVTDDSIGLGIGSIGKITKRVMLNSPDIKKLKMVKEGKSSQHELTRDGKSLFKGSYNECLKKLQSVSPHSWQHSLKHEGYKIKPVKEEVVEEAFENLQEYGAGSLYGSGVMKFKGYTITHDKKSGKITYKKGGKTVHTSKAYTPYDRDIKRQVDKLEKAKVPPSRRLQDVKRHDGTVAKGEDRY